MDLSASDPVDPVDLLDLAPRWSTVTGRSPDGLPSVIVLDDAAVERAPWSGYPVQIGLGIRLEEPGPDGQPGLAERPALQQLQEAYAEALAEHGRVVASVTLEGIYELIAYSRDTAWVEEWQVEGPPGMAGGHQWEMYLMDDPRWTGLRELAGLLEPGETAVRPG